MLLDVYVLYTRSEMVFFSPKNNENVNEFFGFDDARMTLHLLNKGRITAEK